MFIRKKWLNIFIVTILFCTVILSGPANASAVPEEPRKVKEVTGLRTEYSKTYEMDNGQFQCEVHASPIHYKGSKGQLLDINNSVTDKEVKEGYKYSNTANAWRTYFADSITQKSAVSIEKDGYAVSFCLADPNVNSKAETASSLNKSASELDRQLSEDSRTVVYKNIYGA
jgi:hypothetical protein